MSRIDALRAKAHLHNLEVNVIPNTIEGAASIVTYSDNKSRVLYVGTCSQVDIILDGLIIGKSLYDKK